MRSAILVLDSILAGLLASGATLPTAPLPASPGLRILSDVVLPPSFDWASDVRWASDQSVYLALAKDGTVEMSLDPKGPPPKEMIPGASKPGGFWASHRLAVSSQYLVAAGPAMSLTWRRLADPSRVEEAFEGIQALDARENQLAIVGLQRDEKGNIGTDGAIAWLGSLDKKNRGLEADPLRQRRSRSEQETLYRGGAKDHPTSPRLIVAELPQN